MKIKKEIVSSVYALPNQCVPDLIDKLLTHLHLNIEITTITNTYEYGRHGDYRENVEYKIKLVPKT